MIVRAASQSVSCAKGFTLIELVAAIVLMAVALTFMISLFFANPGRSVEPLLQIRAAEFGQALMEEILAKPFDQATPLGGIPACAGLACTASGSLGNEGAVRASYNDVDDYHSYCLDDGSGAPGWPIINALGDEPEDFDRFRMRVCVGYDDDYDGTINEAGVDVDRAKLIRIEIYAPQVGGLASAIVFSAYRGNY